MAKVIDCSQEPIDPHVPFWHPEQFPPTTSMTTLCGALPKFWLVSKIKLADEAVVFEAEAAVRPSTYSA